MYKSFFSDNSIVQIPFLVLLFFFFDEIYTKITRIAALDHYRIWHFQSMQRGKND